MTIQLAQRIRFEENTILYVNPAGSDDNNGSVNFPFATMQGAYDYLAWNVDLVRWGVTVLCSQHPRNAGISSALSIMGQGVNAAVTFRGAPTPAVVGSDTDFNTVLSYPITVAAGSPGGHDAFVFGAGSSGGAKVFIEGFFVTTPLGNGISCYGGGTGVGFDRIVWGAAAGAHQKCAHGAELGAERGASGYEWVVGGAYAHVIAETGGRFTSDGLRSDSRNSPAFSVNYLCSNNSQMNLGGMVFPYAQYTTGYKAVAQAGGVICTGYGGNDLPGSIAPLAVTGGIIT